MPIKTQYGLVNPPKHIILELRDSRCEEMNEISLVRIAWDFTPVQPLDTEEHSKTLALPGLLGVCLSCLVGCFVVLLVACLLNLVGWLVYWFCTAGAQTQDRLCVKPVLYLYVYIQAPENYFLPEILPYTQK